MANDSVGVIGGQCWRGVDGGHILVFHRVWPPQRSGKVITCFQAYETVPQRRMWFVLLKRERLVRSC